MDDLLPSISHLRSLEISVVVSGASALSGSTLWVQNRQNTSDGTSRQDINPHFGCRSAYRAASNISVAEVWSVKSILRDQTNMYLVKPSFFTSKMVSSAALRSKMVSHLG
jgi:hypothetical protein